MSSLKDLMAQKAELERQIEQAQAHSRREAIEQIRSLMTDNGLTLADLQGEGRKASAKTKEGRTKVAAKYRNQATGDVWTGRGLKPKWLKAELDAGRKLEDFAV